MIFQSPSAQTLDAVPLHRLCPSAKCETKKGIEFHNSKSLNGNLYQRYAGETIESDDDVAFVAIF